METLEKLIETYKVRWQYGMTNTIRYSEVVADLETIKEAEKEQKRYSDEDVREMLFTALNEPQQECCITHTNDSIVRKVLKTFKTQQ